MMEYDETLGSELVLAGYSTDVIFISKMWNEIWMLFGINTYNYGTKYNSREKIEYMLKVNDTGCVFKMPDRDMEYVFASKKSANEIRRIIKLKAFI